MYGSEKVKVLTQRRPFLNKLIPIRSLDFASGKKTSLNSNSKKSSQFHDTRVFRHRWGECRSYTAFCVHKMAFSMAGSASKGVGQTGHAL